MEVIFIRHGQTATNVLDAVDTAYPGAPLNKTGLTQAQQVPTQWRNLALKTPDAVIASPLLRTRQSAAPLAKFFGLPLLTDIRLREVRAGNFEMLHYFDAHDAYLSHIAAWINGKTDHRMPAGECGRQVIGRVDSLLADLATKYGATARVALVTHGALTRLYSACRIDGLSADLVMTQPIRNCVLTVIDGTPESGWNAKLYSSRPIPDWEVTANMRRFRRSFQVISD